MQILKLIEGQNEISLFSGKLKERALKLIEEEAPGKGVKILEDLESLLWELSAKAVTQKAFNLARKYI